MSQIICSLTCVFTQQSKTKRSITWTRCTSGIFFHSFIVPAAAVGRTFAVLRDWISSWWNVVALTSVSAIHLDFIVSLAPADVGVVLATCTPVVVFATGH